MTQNYHTAIATGAAANAATINAPLGELDSKITSEATDLDAVQSEVIAARGAYGDLDARLDALILSGGNVATLTNGAAAAGQKNVTVDSTTGFLAAGRVAYLLAGGTVEYNTIGSITDGTHLVLGTNIGTGGIADNTYLSMISESEYQAAQAVLHSGALTLPEAMEYAAGGMRNVMAYGAAGDGVTNDTTAVQAALTAGGDVYFPPGTYLVTGLTSGASTKSMRGSGAGSIIKSATDAAVLSVSASDLQIVGVKFEGDGLGATYDGGKTAQDGVLINDKYRVEILGCTFYNLGGAGVSVTTASLDGHEGSRVVSCRFLSCNNGIHADARGEYITAVGCEFSGCNRGLLIEGGNSIASGCNISDNLTGVKLIAGTNNGHGICTGCNINHNTDYSVHADGCTEGFTFVGCHIYDSNMLLDAAVGVVFQSCSVDQDAYYFDGCDGCAIENCVLGTRTNTINNDYNGNLSYVRWYNNRDINGDAATAMSQLDGGWVRLTLASDLVLTPSATPVVLTGWTAAVSAVANDSPHAKHAFYNSGTGEVTVFGLGHNKVDIFVYILMDKPSGYADNIQVDVFLATTRLAYLPIVSLSSTLLMVSWSGTFYTDPATAITFKITNNSSANLTIDKDYAKIEVKGL